MNAYRCDRCGTFHLSKYFYKVAAERNVDGNRYSVNTKTLCPGCAALLDLDPKVTQMIIDQAEYEDKILNPKKEEIKNETSDN